jgi:hypothetical protein
MENVQRLNGNGERINPDKSGYLFLRYSPANIEKY